MSKVKAQELQELQQLQDITDDDLLRFKMMSDELGDQWFSATAELQEKYKLSEMEIKYISIQTLTTFVPGNILAAVNNQETRLELANEMFTAIKKIINELGNSNFKIEFN